jgi:PAS domain S-box-containing protein
VIALGAVMIAVLLPRGSFSPLAQLAFLVLLSALTSAFKVQFPIATGSNMSVSYVVNIASLILHGPHAAMVVGVAAGWTQSTLNVRSRTAGYRVLFNIALLAIAVELAGQTFQRFGGTPELSSVVDAVALLVAAVVYYLVNTIPIALAIALTTTQSTWRVWRSDFASSGPSFILGAAAAAVVIRVTNSSGYWLTLLLTAAPLYLTYRMYRTGRDTEARQGAILEAAHDAIITMDPELNIREFNPAAEQMFGYRQNDILGRNVELLIPPADRVQQQTALAEYVESGRGPLANRRLEMTGLRADGTEFPVELTVARVPSDSRAAVTSFIRDITERRALEDQLRQSQKLEAIGRLAGGIAHDFNNILMSIMGSADLLMMELSPTDPARSEALEIKLSIERGAGVTRQLLAFSRRQATRPRLFALADVVRGMETMLRRLIGPEIDFGIIFGGEPVTVMADSGQIEQVIMNLVINARDAMPDGGQLSIRIDDVDLDDAAAVTLVEGQAGRYARLSVSDNGTGMSEQTRARLFEPFFTTKEQGKGTGLGLSIVYGIVKQSRGYITVSSEVGRGTTFYIYLPIAAAAELSPAVA